MSYGLKYQTQFNSQADANTASVRYTLQFLFKDYSGGVTSITGGETTVIQNCSADDPFAPIKGQSLSINLINYGNIPLTAFYADEDDGIQVILKDENDNVKFIGFIVQEDSYEEMVDYAHQISLSANDSLGLLKGVVLNEAEARRSYQAQFRTNGDNSVVYMYVSNTAFYPQAGNPIELQGTVYTIVSAVNETTVISSIGYNWTINVTPATGGISPADEIIYLTGSLNLQARNSLLSLIAVCLGNTNIDLILNIYCNLKCFPQDGLRSHFEQTILDSQMFISGESYEDCYSVLSKILSTFNCSLFQANGMWNIMHWEEMRFYTGNAIPAYQYDETYSFLGTTVFNNNFFIGTDPHLTRPVYPLNRGSFRPYKFVRKQFNYVNPKYLLLNAALQKIGNLIRSYVNGSETWKEYELPDWYDGDMNTLQCTRYMRIIYDSSNNEVTRYIVVKGNPGPSFVSVVAIKSNNIEINEGDIIKINLSYQTDISQPGNGTVGVQHALRVNDGTNYKFARNWTGDGVPGPGHTPTFIDPVWDIVNSFPTTIPKFWLTTIGNNTNEWSTVTIETARAESAGILNLFLSNVCEDIANETRYKDFTIEIIPTINESTKITGHVHKQNQDLNIKNNTDDAIYIDDSPRNSIAGTLFLTSVTNLLQDRTQFWRYIYHPSDEYYKLGELMTEEQIRWRKQLRTKLEGGFIGLYQDNCISLLTIGKTSFDINKNYVPGLMSIDYKRNQFNATWWEVWDSEETALDSDYSFTYIYSTT